MHTGFLTCSCFPTTTFFLPCNCYNRGVVFRYGFHHLFVFPCPHKHLAIVSGDDITSLHQAWITNFEGFFLGFCEECRRCEPFVAAKTHSRQRYYRLCPCKVNATLTSTLEWADQLKFPLEFSKHRDKYRYSNSVLAPGWIGLPTKRRSNPG